MNLKGLAGGCLDPFSVDVTNVGLEERRVLELFGGSYVS